MTTTATPNFSSILDESPTEIDRPKPMPEGTYTFVVGSPRYDKSPKKGTPLVEFIVRPFTAGDDVDTDALDEAGGLQGKTLKATFYLTEDAIWRLDEFHQHCGINLMDETSRRIRNDQVLGAQVLGYVKHETSEDGTQVFAKIKRYAPVE
jgi:hypothetical protein